ncbi:hypothetical protein P5E53_15480, partial [Clostridium perfringens]|nr:hypothetical protein [Clostridium perfringens]
IVFIKAKPTAVASSSLAFSEVDGLLTAENEKPEEKEDKATRLYLSKDSLLNIQKNKADYDEFLRKTTQSEQGKFKPWQLMEEISEKIFDDCMT